MIHFDFPEKFVWGCATASNQIEGAVDVDGKSPSIWDADCRDFPGEYWNGHNFNTTIADFYYHYKDDIANMRELGLKSFRFSLSWPRIIPAGRGEVNPKGIAFYNAVIDELLANGIEPFVDLYHWDLPECLGKEGSFLREGIADDFAAYAEVCFRAFGDRVKYWSTINEPSAMWCFTGADPRFFDTESAGHYFNYVRNVLNMHYAAVKTFRRVIPAGRAKIGAVSAFVPIYATSGNRRDIDAAQRRGDFMCGVWFSGIIQGKCPDSLLRHTHLACPERERLLAELPERFVPVDFMGVNYYYPNIVGYQPDQFLETGHAAVYYAQQDYGFFIYPQGLFDTLMTFKNEYGNVEVFLTENGFATDRTTRGANLEDSERIDYLREHLRELGRAVQAGCNISGYFLWSIVDTFECHNGLRYQFGLNHVDLETKKRTKRQSWTYYRDVIAGNRVF